MDLGPTIVSKRLWRLRFGDWRWRALVMLVGVGWIGFAIACGVSGESAGRKTDEGESAVPVEIGPIERGSIASRRVFSGTLEASAAFVVAPKVSGRIKYMAVDLADTVTRGQLVAQLDDEESRQNVVQARAERKVAQAQEQAATHSLAMAQRSLARVQELRRQGIASEQELEGMIAARFEVDGVRQVAAARVSSATATLRAAELQVEYTQIHADWPKSTSTLELDPDSGQEGKRVVAERFADAGQTVPAHAPLLSIVDLDPVIVVVFVTESDYVQLRPGQAVLVETDAYPDETFRGEVARISPVFQEQSRQARVELAVHNPDKRLHPGMFVRAQTILSQKNDAVLVPEEALVTRDGRSVVFIVAQNGKTVSLRPVKTGIRDGGKVEIETTDQDSPLDLSGWVVTLGQQQLQDQTTISVPAGFPREGPTGTISLGPNLGPASP